MEWPLSHAARGRRLSPPHSCWPTSSGGALITILCAPMPRCEWHSCSRASGVVILWRNGTGSVRKLWQQEERTDGGPRQKCCLIPYRKCQTANRERECNEGSLAQWRWKAWKMKARKELEGLPEEAAP